MRIDQLPASGVHAVGVAGLETATMVRYLVEHGNRDIVLHDVADDVDRAFDAAHRFQPFEQVERSRQAMRTCLDLRAGPRYLEGIEEATAIVVPVSWFLHAHRDRLAPLHDRFVLYTDACFDLFAGRIIAVTGTYGKTTTSRFAATLTDGHLCGNDREFTFDLDALARAAAEECLVFETSNRHLANGFRRVVDVGVVTGISLNHEPDHGSFEQYRATKYSMAERCRRLLYHASIPQRFADAGALDGQGFVVRGGWSVVVVGRSRLRPNRQRMRTARHRGARSAQPRQCTGGGCGGAAQRRHCGRRPTTFHGAGGHATALSTSAEQRDGRTLINDAAACVPAGTAELVATLSEPFVLICGGDRQRYRPGEFDDLARALAANRMTAGVVTTGPMAAPIEAALVAAGCRDFCRADSVRHAVELAMAIPDVAVVFSPGCGTGTLFVDKYARGEEFDAAVDRLVPAGQAVR